MSLLDTLQKQKHKLKKTATVVTKVDGQRFLESRDGGVVEKLDSCYGFVVDTKPDNVPVNIIDYLYIGSQDCTAGNVLEAHNIDYVLSLGINVDIDTNICHKFVECLDLPETDIKPVLHNSLPFIHEGIESGKNVLVHCNAGVSRTAMVALGYLIIFKGMSYNDAYNLVKSKRPPIQPNAGFQKQLRSLTQ